MDVIDPANDALLLAAIRLEDDGRGNCSPYIIDYAVFSMVECIRARDDRLKRTGGIWVGGVPRVVKDTSAHKYVEGKELSADDYEKDTNFGKLKRIPYLPLQAFMVKHGAIKAARALDAALEVEEDE